MDTEARKQTSDAWGVHYERACGQVGRDGLILRDRDYERHMEQASVDLLEAMERFYAERVAA